MSVVILVRECNHIVVHKIRKHKIGSGSGIFLFFLGLSDKDLVDWLSVYLCIKFILNYISVKKVRKIIVLVLIGVFAIGFLSCKFNKTD